MPGTLGSDRCTWMADTGAQTADTNASRADTPVYRRLPRVEAVKGPSQPPDTPDQLANRLTRCPDRVFQDTQERRIERGGTVAARSIFSSIVDGERRAR